MTEHPAPTPAVPTTDPNTTYTRREAAAYLGISEAMLKKLALAGRGPAAIRFGRRWSYLHRDLEAFRELHRVDPRAEQAQQEAA